MEKIENLFKHNIFFTPVNEDRTSYISNDNFSINVEYVTKEIILRGDKNIKYPKDLLDRIDPFFLYYLASRYQKYKENNQYEAFFQVDFIFGDSNDTNYSYSVKRITARECVDGDISVLDKSSENRITFFSSHSIIGGIFRIRIFLRADYYKEEAEEESEAEGEEEEESEKPVINAAQSFKSNECVICLDNPPNVLFCNCGHMCICVKCDRVKSLETCPVCKTKSTIKRMVE